MWAIFKHQMRRFRGSILGWGIPLAALAAYLIPFYSSMGEQLQLMEELLKAYPPELLAFFGAADAQSMLTPEGFMHVELFSYLPVVLGIFALLSGSGLLASDEEKGFLDLLLSLPVSRSALFVARLSAWGLTTLIILALIWAALAATAVTESFAIGPAALLLPFVDVASMLFLVGSLALCLSQFLPSRRVAAMMVGLLLLASFFVNGLAQVDPDLLDVARLLPLYYYQGGAAVNGLNMTWLVGKGMVGALFLALGWWRFTRRDVRVSGEGDWPNWRRFVRRRKTTVARPAPALES